MNERKALEFVTGCFATKFEIPVEKIVLDASIFNDLGLDSIDALDLVGMLESELNIEVEEGDIRSIRTVGDVVKYIIRKTDLS